MKKLIFIILIASLVIVSCGRREVVVPRTEVIQREVGPKTIFYDNFNSRKNEWQQIRGNWKVDPRGFFLQRSADERALNSVIYVDHPQAADATYETYVRITPDLPTYITGSMQDQRLLNNVRYIIGAGIIFRMQDSNNFYMFRLAGEEGAVLGKMVDGEWIDIANPRSANFLPERVKFSEANWYRLRVDAYGSSIVCYINDSVVVSSSDTTFTLGNFGLVTFKTKADFDYFKVYTRQELENR
jgi:hypothetical protein